MSAESKFDKKYSSISKETSLLQRQISERSVTTVHT